MTPIIIPVIPQGAPETPQEDTRDANEGANFIRKKRSDIANTGAAMHQGGIGRRPHQRRLRL